MNIIIRKKSVISLLLLFIFPVFTGKSYSQSRDIVKFEKAKENFRKGFIYFNNNQYLAAVEFFRKAVTEYPDYYTARDYLARSYKLSGFTDEAVRELENLKDVSKDDVLIQSKIDSLRFRDTFSDQSIMKAELVLNGKYHSADFKRYSFSNPMDAAVDEEKNLYVGSFSSGKLVKIDPNGNAISVLRNSVNGKIYGVDYFKGRVAATEFKDDQLLILSKDGDLIKKSGKSGAGDGEFHGPEGVCFDPSGYIYVVDSGNSRVQKFDADGKFILKFGEKGEYEAQFDKPTDIAFLNGELFVTDSGNKRIAVFDDSGNFIKNIKIDGLEIPRGITVNKNSLLISDEKSGLIFYNPANGEKKRFSSWNGKKEHFSRLSSTVVDRDGFMYSVDFNTETVFIFSPVQKMYSNLELEVASVDTKKFPVVAFYLNVRGPDGRPVYGLTRENFKVVEDSASIKNVSVDYLKKKDPAASIVLCVDRSRDSEGNHNELSWLADFILKKMNKGDSVKVVNFNKEVWEGNNFDWSRRRSLRAIQQKKYSTGKDFGSVLYNSIGDLTPRISRRGVVLVTDGKTEQNSFAQYTPENIIQYAKSHYIPIYIVSFNRPDALLSRIAFETGGAVIRPSKIDELRSVYDRIVHSEEYRYVLVYSTFKLPAFKGLWSDIKLEVNYKGQKGVEKGGYFVP